MCIVVGESSTYSDITSNSFWIGRFYRRLCAALSPIHCISIFRSALAVYLTIVVSLLELVFSLLLFYKISQIKISISAVVLGITFAGSTAVMLSTLILHTGIKAANYQAVTSAPPRLSTCWTGICCVLNVNFKLVCCFNFNLSIWTTYFCMCSCLLFVWIPIAHADIWFD